MFTLESLQHALAAASATPHTPQMSLEDHLRAVYTEVLAVQASLNEGGVEQALLLVKGADSWDRATDPKLVRAILRREGAQVSFMIAPQHGAILIDDYGIGIAEVMMGSGGSSSVYLKAFDYHKEVRATRCARIEGNQLVFEAVYTSGREVRLDITAAREFAGFAGNSKGTGWLWAGSDEPAWAGGMKDAWTGYQYPTTRARQPYAYWTSLGREVMEAVDDTE